MATHHREILEEAHASETGLAKFNRTVGIAVTNGVATLWCAYAFAALALISLPAAIQASFLTGGFKPLPIVTWVAQTFLQLVLLSVILFGQNMQSEKADARGEATYRNTQAAEVQFAEVLRGIAERGEENARMKAQNNEILQHLEAHGESQG